MNGLRYAFNTNGCAHHRLDDALEFIADAGYDGVALTLDHHHFDPLEPNLERRTARLSRRLSDLGLGCVIETGARFLLDPRRKHEPTLVSPDHRGRERRVEFLIRALDIAALCDAEAVSFWAGVVQPQVDRERARGWFLDGLSIVAEQARTRGIPLALEPEPGHLIETCDDWRVVQTQLPDLTLALDIGHLLVTGESDPETAIFTHRNHLGTVAIEDMEHGVHVHRMFGEGDLDVPSALAALHAVEFKRLVSVELSRDSHRAHETIPGALKYLRTAEARLTDGLSASIQAGATSNAG